GTTNDVWISGRWSPHTRRCLIFDYHFVFWMEAIRRRLIDYVHGERLIADRLHHKFKPGRHENCNIFLQFGSIATGCDFSLPTKNVIDFLLTLEMLRCG